MCELDYTEIEKEIFNSHNVCRNNPFSYIMKLKEITNYFKDKTYQHPYEDAIMTYEGADSIEDAISFLKALKPCGPLKYSEDISKACRDHAEDIGSNGLMSHEGSDGTNITDRIERYCEWDGIVAENLDFGFRIGENVIMNMIIDDGVKERPQRKNIFSKEFNYIGIGVSPHTIYGICVVIGYAKNIRKIGSEPENVTEWIKKYYGDERKEENMHLTNNIDNGITTNFNYHVNYSSGFINEFKFIEPDAPENSISLRISKNKKIINNIEKRYTKKTFLLKNGVNHIIEIEGI